MVDSSVKAYTGLLPPSVLEQENETVWSKRWPELLAAEDHWTMLLVDGEEPRGLALTYADEGDAAVFGLLHVSPAHWGSGAAGQLHAAAIDDLRRRGFATCTLWVLEENLRARRFYAKHGWQLTKERRHFIARHPSLRYRTEF